MTDLTLDRVREFLSYDPETGQFRWRISRRPGVPPGRLAGSTDTYGYRQICIDGRKHLAHRIAWAVIHGAWPADEIDHINGNRADNRIVNLREASRKINVQNRRSVKGSTPTPYGRHIAKISVDGKEIYLGVFPTPEQAHAAYVAAKRQLHIGCTI